MREKLGMDFAWKFHLDNLERPIPNNMMYYYLHTKAERGRGPAAASFYDGDWEVVDLPHDYAISRQRMRESASFYSLTVSPPMRRCM